MLYVVPTPIGNLSDISERAIQILKEVDLILCEDTRTSSTLFTRFEIQNKLSSFHMHNEHKKLESIISQLKAGADIALVSDSGTPGISDPGFLLVRECIKEQVEVDCLPGPTAFVPALVLSGLPCDRFVFEGFLPQKKGRMKRLEELKEEHRTIVFYESPHRLVKFLEQCADVLGDERVISVSREISKMHHETRRGTIREVKDYFESKPVKGEFVVVVSGKEN